MSDYGQLLEYLDELEAHMPANKRRPKPITLQVPPSAWFDAEGKPAEATPAEATPHHAAEKPAPAAETKPAPKR